MFCPAGEAEVHPSQADRENRSLTSVLSRVRRAHRPRGRRQDGSGLRASECRKISIPGGLFYLGDWVSLPGGATANMPSVRNCRPARKRGCRGPLDAVLAFICRDIAGRTTRIPRVDGPDRTGSSLRHRIRFPYFYGLEHRLFPGRADDGPLLVREVERLLRYSMGPTAPSAAMRPISSTRPGPSQGIPFALPGALSRTRRRFGNGSRDPPLPR